MKFKFIFTLVLIAAAISGVFYGLTHWSLHKGATAAHVTEFSATGSWPVRYVGIYRDLLTGEEKEFSAFDPIAREQLEKAVGQNVVLKTENHFLSLWNSHAHSVRGVEPLELEVAQKPASEDGLCRLVEVIRRSKPMVDVLRQRVEKYDAKLLERVRECADQ